MEEEQVRDLKAENEMLIFLLSNIAESKSYENPGHNMRLRALTEKVMTEYAKATSTEVSTDEIELIGKAAMLHDLGKLCLHKSLLTKPGRLTEDEFETIKTHSVLGRDIVAAFAGDCRLKQYAMDTCEFHHEKIDGSGYPYGMSDVPDYIQVISLCDVFDSLTHSRNYSRALNKDEAMALIQAGKCGSFDPVKIESLLRVISGKEENS